MPNDTHIDKAVIIREVLDQLMVSYLHMPHWQMRDNIQYMRKIIQELLDNLREEQK